MNIAKRQAYECHAHHCNDEADSQHSKPFHFYQPLVLLLQGCDFLPKPGFNIILSQNDVDQLRVCHFCEFHIKSVFFTCKHKAAQRNQFSELLVKRNGGLIM